ncbi:hypothetical protein ACSBR2_018903 [Camellia fascicularis]
MWSTSPDYVEIIRKNWDSPFAGSPMFRLVRKLRACREGLKVWSKANFGNNKIQIAMLKAQLATLQAQPSSDENFQLQEIVLSREEMFLHQRSRVCWLNFGDRNLSFFHASLIQRRQRNQILRNTKCRQDLAELRFGNQPALLRLFFIFVYQHWQ